jgi:hypothetical protein
LLEYARAEVERPAAALREDEAFGAGEAIEVERPADALREDEAFGAGEATEVVI